MISASLLAQPLTNAPEAAAPAPVAAEAAMTLPDAPTNAPAAKAPKKKAAPKKKKKAVKKPAAAALRTTPLTTGPATVVANHVNVRGQPKLKSEVVAHLTKEQVVTVLEEIVHNDSGPEEPSAWAKILLPADTHVWVNGGFIDPATKTVTPKKLNLRGGPGENYSVLGVLVRGDAVNQVGAKGDWLEIDSPTNAYAFVASQYLKQEPLASPAIAPAEPATVAQAPPPAPPVEMPAPDALAPAVTNAPAEAAATTAQPPAAEEPPPKRIVLREGVVRGTTSIQAPTPFELFSPETGRTIDWLYTTSHELDLRRYKGLRIIVSGEEGLEERWGKTPVITIETIKPAD